MLSTKNLDPENGMQSGVGIVYFRMSSLQNLKGPLLRFSNVVQTVMSIRQFFFFFTPPKVYSYGREEKKTYVAGFVMFEITNCELAVEAGIIFRC